MKKVVLKKKQPCQTPGCNWPNFHVCLVGKPDTFPELLGLTKPKGPQTPRSAEHSAAISSAQQERWDAINGVRNKRMVEYYKKYMVGYKAVAKKFGVSPSTALKVLKKAEARGELEMRSRGVNVRHLINN